MRLAASVALVTLAAAAPRAAAEPALPSARHVARAGATLVSDDGAGALLANPAGLARSAAPRAELGLVVRDGDARFRADGDHPTIVDRAGAGLRPAVAVAAGLGDRFAIGVGYVDTSDAASDLPTPEPGQPAADVARLFPHRYGGTAAARIARTAMVGGAVRLGEAVAIGAALHATRLERRERRTLWAGFAGRDALGDPARDLELDVDATVPLALGGAVGVLVAPPSLPLELALGARGRLGGRATGAAALVALHDAPPVADLDGPTAAIDLPATWDLALGARATFDRIGVEAAAELGGAAAATPRWELEGVAAVDETGARGPLAEVPALLTERRRWAARAALEVAAVDGFLWLTGGYAYASAGRSPGRQSPAAIDLGGHTLALGAEAAWDGLAVTVGYARTLAAARTLAPAGVPMVNPFGAGTTVAAPGRYDAASDWIGLALRAEWP